MRFLSPLFLLLTVLGLSAQDKTKDDFPKIDPNVIATSPEKAKELAASLQKGLRDRRDVVNKADLEAWRKVENLKQWETFRDTRIENLRKAIADFPEVPKELPVKVTKTIEGDTYKIDCLLYESRKGFWVSANLYRPSKVTKKSAGIIIIHSHHNPKTEGELQDMGVTWARAGATVLVPDMLGHGERRTHPFVDEKSYPEAFRVSRQDYWFRYNTGMQLSLIGDSLIGWFAWDVMRGVDLLLKQEGVDPEKIALLGSVAGGGDPAAVTAALDKRIKVLVPFNFGGPQPETKFPLPEDAELSFNYVGGGSWESTRNIAGSAKGGFLPWEIVGSIAPRGLIHAHEFAWDEKRDPIWARYQKIWKWTGSEKLAYTHGRGSVTGSAPESTHCNNIGLEHRKGIHPAFEKWLDLKVEETKDRRPSKDLWCWNEKIQKVVFQKDHAQVMFDITKKQDDKYSKAMDGLTEAQKREKLCKDWTNLLALEPSKGTVEKISSEEVDGYKVEKWTIVSDEGHKVPVVILSKKAEKVRPVVVGITGLGKEKFLTERKETLKLLLEGEIAVCLFDPRWTGEVKIGNDRGRGSSLTSISATEQMFGTPVMGQRLEDTLAVIDFLKGHKQIDSKKMILWGESFAKDNNDVQTSVPMDAAKYPNLGDTCGSTLAALAALFRPEVKGVISRGGLLNYSTILLSPFVYHSHDIMIPGVTRLGDLELVWDFASKKNVLIESPVNGENKSARKFEREQMQNRLNAFVNEKNSTEKGLAEWVLGAMKK